MVVGGGASLSSSSLEKLYSNCNMPFTHAHNTAHTSSHHLLTSTHHSSYLDYKSDQENTATTNININTSINNGPASKATGATNIDHNNNNNATTTTTSLKHRIKHRVKQHQQHPQHQHQHDAIGSTNNYFNYNNATTTTANTNELARGNGDGRVEEDGEDKTKVVVVSSLKRGCDDVEGETTDDEDNNTNNNNIFLDYNNNHYLANGNHHHLNIIGPPQSISMGLGMNGGNGGNGGGRKSPAKKPKFVVTYKEMREFFTLLNEESIREFLKRDSCCLISDKVTIHFIFSIFMFY